jgi:hypothetical protein
MKSVFISYGGGIQTFAMLVLAEKGKIKADEVVFSDTGAEHQETYNHIEQIAKPLCKKLGIEFTTTRMSKVVTERETGEKKIASSLIDVVQLRKRIPSLKNRWCTEYSKIVPIKMYLREEQKRLRYEKPAVALIGISVDEWQRMHKPHLSEYTVSYPLIDLRLTRSDCIRLIKESGYPLPPKSGCYFCPFQGTDQWRKLYNTERDKFDHSMKLEEQDPKFPTYSLARDRKGPLPLRNMKIRFGDGSRDLTEFTLDMRVTMSCLQEGYCHV